MEYHEVDPISREEALTAFASNDPELVCTTLVQVAYYDPDWQWVQEQCINFTKHPNLDICGLAVTCLGHIARIHRTLEIDKVLPILKELYKNPKIAGLIDDTLDDFEIYLGVDL